MAKNGGGSGSEVTNYRTPRSLERMVDIEYETTGPLFTKAAYCEKIADPCSLYALWFSYVAIAQVLDKRQKMYMVSLRP